MMYTRIGLLGSPSRRRRPPPDDCFPLFCLCKRRKRTFLRESSSSLLLIDPDGLAVLGIPVRGRDLSWSQVMRGSRTTARTRDIVRVLEAGPRVAEPDDGT
jgi:hypothetical protein